MLKIELIECGLDETLREIRENLYSVVGKSSSKKEKDDMIYKAIGALTTLYYTIRVEELDAGTESESD